MAKFTNIGLHLFLILFLFGTLFITRKLSGEILSCAEKQFAFLDEEGILNCTITESFYGVYWYIGQSKDSIIRYINQQKAGPEYQNGKLDIAENGSMIIQRVSLSDEKYYRVMVVLTAGGDVSSSVHLTVIVKTWQTYPTISGCSKNTDEFPCVLCINNIATLVCKMDGKPPVSLTWYEKNTGAALPNQVQNTIDNKSANIFTSSTEVNPQLPNSGHHTELICHPSGKALPPHPQNASVLVTTPSGPETKREYVYFVINETFSLGTCSPPNDTEMIAWIKQTIEPVIWNNLFQCEYISNSFGSDKLTIQKTSKDDEGIFTSITWRKGNFKRCSFRFKEGVPPELDEIETKNDSQSLTLTVKKTDPPADITVRCSSPCENVTISSVASKVQPHDHLFDSSVRIYYNIAEGVCGFLEYEITGPWGIPTFYQSGRYEVCRDKVISTHNVSAESTTGEPPRSDKVISTHNASVQSTTGEPPCSGDSKVIPGVIVAFLCVLTVMVVLTVIVVLILRWWKNRGTNQSTDSDQVASPSSRDPTTENYELLKKGEGKEEAEGEGKEKEKEKQPYERATGSSKYV